MKGGDKKIYIWDPRTEISIISLVTLTDRTDDDYPSTKTIKVFHGHTSSQGTLANKWDLYPIGDHKVITMIFERDLSHD